jgi:hypothetical protein
MRNALFGLVLIASPTMAKEPAPATVGGGHMQHCPTAVEGSDTKIAETKDAVEITVTATDKAKTDDIRKRAAHVLSAEKKNPTTVEHSGDGHGGGGLGRCEVVLMNTTVTSADVEGGVKITVKPNRPVDFEWLKKEVATRHAENLRGKKPIKKAEK